MPDTMVNERAATVWTTPDGAPQRFVWQQRRFVVCAKPIPWIDRVPWWETSARVPVHGGAMVEQSMWQVQAKALDNGELLIVDLAASETSQWAVTAVFD